MFRLLLAIVGATFWVGSIRAELRVGTASVRITPGRSMPMAGYYNTRLSTNTHDELQAKAIVFEQGDRRVAVVVCDLISLPRAVVVQARETIVRTTSIPGGNVMISAGYDTIYVQ